MPWVRLDEEFPDHPKVVTAGPLAGWLHVCALAYCNRHLTDGFIPRAQVGRLVNFAGIINLDEDPGPCDVRDMPDVSPYELADRLVSLGVWERRQGGFAIHDFLDYQPSRAEIEAQRKVKKDAGRAGGIRSGESRRSRTEAEPKQTAKQEGSRTGSTTEAERQANGQAKTKPDPVPVPLVDRSSSSNTVAGPPSEEEEELRARVTTAVKLIAERRLAARNGEPLTNTAAWLRKVQAEAMTDHGIELAEMAARGLSSRAMADQVILPPSSPYPAAGEPVEPAWPEDAVSVDEHGRLVVVRSAF